MDFNTHTLFWIQHFGQNLQLVLVSQPASQPVYQSVSTNLALMAIFVSLGRAYMGAGETQFAV